MKNQQTYGHTHRGQTDNTLVTIGQWNGSIIGIFIKSLLLTDAQVTHQCVLNTCHQIVFPKNYWQKIYLPARIFPAFRWRLAPLALLDVVDLMEAEEPFLVLLMEKQSLQLLKWISKERINPTPLKQGGQPKNQWAYRKVKQKKIKIPFHLKYFVARGLLQLSHPPCFATIELQDYPLLPFLTRIWFLLRMKSLGQSPD